MFNNWPAPLAFVKSLISALDKRINGETHLFPQPAEILLDLIDNQVLIRNVLGIHTDNAWLTVQHANGFVRVPFDSIVSYSVVPMTKEIEGYVH